MPVSARWISIFLLTLILTSCGTEVQNSNRLNSSRLSNPAVVVTDGSLIGVSVDGSGRISKLWETAIDLGAKISSASSAEGVVFVSAGNGRIEALRLTETGAQSIAVGTAANIVTIHAVDQSHVVVSEFVEGTPSGMMQVFEIQSSNLVQTDETSSPGLVWRMEGNGASFISEDRTNDGDTATIWSYAGGLHQGTQYVIPDYPSWFNGCSCNVGVTSIGALDGAKFSIVYGGFNALYTTSGTELSSPWPLDFAPNYQVHNSTQDLLIDVETPTVEVVDLSSGLSTRLDPSTPVVDRPRLIDSGVIGGVTSDGFRTLVFNGKSLKVGDTLPLANRIVAVLTK